MPKPLNPKRHASALKIAAALHRAENLAVRINNAAINAALKDLHGALAEAHAEHGAVLGLAKVDQYSGGLPK